MRLYKAGGGSTALESVQELDAINKFAKTELKAEEVYTFSVVLCDNEVDRDFERFSNKALDELAELFVGRTGIFDHEWKAANQTARIYRTELINEQGRLNSLGEGIICRRIVNVPRYTRFDAMRYTGEYQISASKEKEKTVALKLTEQFAAFPGDSVKLSGIEFLPEGTFFVGETRCYGNADGAGTEIFLTRREK